MSLRARSAQLLKRTALLLALICLWISGGATLHHADDDFPFFTSAVGHNTLGHATPPAVATACAACQWEQAFSTPHTPTLHVVCLPLVRLGYDVTLAKALHLRPFDYTALRGPPSSLA